MRVVHKVVAVAVVTAVAGVVAAGCGDDSGSSSYGDDSPKLKAAAKSSSNTPSAPASISTKQNAKLGTILAAGNGNKTVYMYKPDPAPKPSCYDECATTWPPVVTEGKPTASSGADSSKLGTAARMDGTTQVTYAGHPLYYYSKDDDEADAYGQGFGGIWYVLDAEGAKVDGDGS